MTLKNMHERMRYATSRGFRVALYFADGMSAGDGLTGIYQPDRVLYSGGWVGPDTKGKTYCQNPLHPAVRSFFIQYIKALLREFGGDIDALVWDETFHVDTGSLGSDARPGYADRALMRLVQDLTAEVHAFNRESGRSLAFLASDCIGVNKWVNKPPYAPGRGWDLPGHPLRPRVLVVRHLPELPERPVVLQLGTGDPFRLHGIRRLCVSGGGGHIQRLWGTISASPR